MAYNLNHGWGRLVANSLMRNPRTGKVIFVSPTSHVNWEEYNEIFPATDKIRVVDDLQEAIDLCTSNEDDVIFVANGHSETITAAGGITLNKTGVNIIGLGVGDNRPTINFTTAVGADFEIDNANCRIENIIFDLTGVDALTGPLDVDAADTQFVNCKFVTADSDGQAVVTIITDANAHRMLLDNCEFVGNTAGNRSAIRIIGGNDIKIKNSTFEGDYKITSGAIEVTTTAVGNLLVENCVINNNTTASVSAMNFV